MKRNLRCISLVLLLVSEASSREKFLTFGLNTSHFYDIGSKSLPGYSLGFGWEWRIGRSSAFVFSPSYLYRGVKLENKTVWDQSYRMFEEDIWCRIGYVDLPFCYRQYFRNTSLNLSAGLSLAFAVHDGSDDMILYERRIFGYPGKHDYNVNIDPGPGYILNSSSLDYMFGSGFRIRRLATVAMIRISIGRVETIARDIAHVNSRFITFSVSGLWYF